MPSLCGWWLPLGIWPEEVVGWHPALPHNYQNSAYFRGTIIFVVLPPEKRHRVDCSHEWTGVNESYTFPKREPPAPRTPIPDCTKSSYTQGAVSLPLPSPSGGCSMTIYRRLHFLSGGRPVLCQMISQGLLVHVHLLISGDQSETSFDFGVHCWNQPYGSSSLSSDCIGADADGPYLCSAYTEMCLLGPPSRLPPWENCDWLVTSSTLLLQDSPRSCAGVPPDPDWEGPTQLCPRLSHV